MDKAWWKKNGATLAALLLILGVALFLRIYFVYPLAFPGGPYSGGSDSYYWERTLRYAFDTGKQLSTDCALNNPLCLTNPRPPMYPWSILLMGWVTSPAFGGDVWAAIVYSFLLSTALWGSLTVLPLYGLVKEAFSRRAGLLAAFLLAVSPGHLQRSVASNADHDAFTLFFVVTAYYFFFRALRTMNERRWVESWRRPASIAAGLRAFFAENRESVLYALLSGMCLTTIALAWQGWAYAPVILLVYVVVQLLVHRFRDVDPMGLTVVFALATGTALALAAPWYVMLRQVRTWFDVPAYLFAAVLVFAILFTVTRDYPWSIVVPAVVAGSVAAVVGAALVNPAFAAALVSGAGYFVSNKLYQTIAEAQAPGLSQVILAFGWPLYFLSWIGVGYLAYQVATGRRPQSAYLFFVVWALAAIFMAQAAARFIFNASPAFAATAAYMFIFFIDRFDYAGLKRQLASLAGGSRIAAFRKSVKVRHVLGAFVIVFFLLPTTFYGVDAAIPFESKHAYDQQIYDFAPGFLRPPGYSSLVGSQGSFYLGAFGFALPQEREAYPSAWKWLATQDAGVPLTSRPAYLSWWDYGFEAVDLGHHPTVADNFQNGYHLAGNFLAAQNESESIALLALRLLDGDLSRNGALQGFSPAVTDALLRAGVDAADLLRAYRNPAALIPVIQGDPDRYGLYDAEMQPQNALYIYGTHALTAALSVERLVELYGSLRGATGWNIRYFAVDTRLFPQDASNTGIFYAPMKLADRRIANAPDGRVIPTDFFRILAMTSTGETKQIQDLLPTDSVQSQQIQYQPMFYDSMFYRAYIGYSPREAGSFANGIPGFPRSGTAGSSQLAQLAPMQAWNLTHWRVVYKTAYFNPFTDVANHTGDWRAVSYDDALQFQKEISAGTRVGTVDLSPASLIQAGVVIVKYYDGAFVNGTVSISGAGPVPGVRVTVQDEFGIPHGSSVTDAQGRYSLVAPFGEVRLIASVGNFSAIVGTGATVLNTTTLTITDEQAMRSPADRDGNGVPDWIIARDIVLPGHPVSGLVFLDADHDGKRTAQEPIASGAVVAATSADLGTTVTAVSSPTGGYAFARLPVGRVHLSASWGGRNLTLAPITVPAGAAVIDLAIPVTSITGTTLLESGASVGGAEVRLRDEVNGSLHVLAAESTGRFAFPYALPGNYTVEASLGDLEAEPVRVLASGPQVTVNPSLVPSGSLDAQVWVAGNPQPFASLTFLPMSAAPESRVAKANETGHVVVRLPAGTYSVSGRVYRATGQGTELWVYLGTSVVAAGGATALTATFVPGAEVRGASYSGAATNRTKDVAVVFSSSAGRYFARTSTLDGTYVAYLPPATYRIQAARVDLAFLGTATVTGSTTIDLPLGRATAYAGTVFRDLNGDGAATPGEGVPNAQVTLADQGRELVEFTDPSGGFQAPLPVGRTYAMTASRLGFADASFPAADIPTLQLRTAVSLTPINASVSGVARYNGVPLTGTSLTIHFAAQGEGARSRDVALGSTGSYAASLVPGRYRVSVDQNVTPGNNATRWQLASPPTLEVAVGQASAALDLVVVQRHRIAGALTLGGQPQDGQVHFSGPDEANLTTTGGAFVVYLRPGSFNVSVTATSGNAGFLGTTSISGPGSVSYALVTTTFVTGRAVVGGSPLSEAVPFTVVRGQGGSLARTTEATGTYAVSLTPGDYTFTVDARSTAAIGGTVRYVRYTSSQALTVSAGQSAIPFDLVLARGLDNLTLSGTVRSGGAGTSASLAFLAKSGAAMNATAAAAANGAFSVALQPGGYGVYAINGAGDRVALRAAALAPRVDATLDLALAPGGIVTGVTTFRGGVRVAASLVFTGVASLAVASDGAGVYRVVLPPDPYAVSAATTVTESGLPVRYSAAANVNATLSPTPLNLELAKEVHRSVVLSWDASQRRTISGGGQVTYSITVRNAGNVAETFALIGSPASWFTFPQPTVHVDFGATGNTATVSVLLHPPANALVQHAPLTVTATSRDDPSAHGSVTVELDIARVRALDLSIASPRYDGRFLNLTAVVANRGNDVERVDLVLANAAELASLGWTGGFASGSGTATSLDNVSVPANGTTSLTVVLRPQGAASGAQAILLATAEDLQSLQATATTTLALPALAPEGGIGATGPLISTTQTFPYQLLAVVISAAAVIGLTAAVTVRRRRR